MQSRRGVRRQLRSARRRRRLAEARAIPSAAFDEHVLLNGMAVDLPATELAKAAKLSFARKLYPSYRYRSRSTAAPA